VELKAHTLLPVSMGGRRCQWCVDYVEHKEVGIFKQRFAKRLYFDGRTSTKNQKVS
jgi:hypothetical protein